ncbi:hypothetical protein L227DRAFT_438606 [Lentinus tigrinus ALCF2SS1-6]|uniref:Uncharacterized protein n=1 Tax=Lentinus tigrinus ALCF2SS1-6 TaxID=1328759 RepID=A0A5C2SGT1_9APHY|nr:hypothetical protein L227DRAFT_438606 [Lentinus tigrinus ALCF2SS1-6]
MLFHRNRHQRLLHLPDFPSGHPRRAPPPIVHKASDSVRPRTTPEISPQCKLAHRTTQPIAAHTRTCTSDWSLAKSPHPLPKSRHDLLSLAPASSHGTHSRLARHRPHYRHPDVNASSRGPLPHPALGQSIPGLLDSAWHQRTCAVAALRAAASPRDSVRLAMHDVFWEPPIHLAQSHPYLELRASSCQLSLSSARPWISVLPHLCARLVSSRAARDSVARSSSHHRALHHTTRPRPRACSSPLCRHVCSPVFSPRLRGADS